MEAAYARLNLHWLKRHIVGNHMSRLIERNNFGHTINSDKDRVFFYILIIEIEQ